MSFTWHNHGLNKLIWYWSKATTTKKNSKKNNYFANLFWNFEKFWLSLIILGLLQNSEHLPWLENTTKTYTFHLKQPEIKTNRSSNKLLSKIVYHVQENKLYNNFNQFHDIQRNDLYTLLIHPWPKSRDYIMKLSFMQ